MTALAIFCWLVVGHALADYPLQGDFLARAKNHRQPIDGFPPWVALWAHSIIHAGAVAFVFSLYGPPAAVWLFGLVELLFHARLDWLKCEGRNSLEYDQFMHVACKALYVLTLPSF